MKAALAVYNAAPASLQNKWATNYLNAVAKVKFVNGVPVVPIANDGPVPVMLASELALAQSGSIDTDLLAQRAFYGTDFTKPLLFMEDGQYYANLAAAQHLTGDQWGVMNETGSYPGQPWLWLYQLWYHLPGWRNSANIDLIAIYMTGAATVLLLLIPFIPGLRDIPRWIPVHRLIWRDWNQQSAAGPAGHPETGPNLSRRQVLRLSRRRVPGPSGRRNNPGPGSARLTRARFHPEPGFTPSPEWPAHGGPLRARSCGRAGRPAERGADGRDLRRRVFARAGPLGLHRVDGGGYGVGGPLVVDPPPDEVRPRLRGLALDREVDLAHPGDRLEELAVGEADRRFRVGLLGNVDAHGPGDPVEAQEPAANAQPRRHFRRRLGGQRQEQRGGVQHGQQRGHPGRHRLRGAEPDQRQVSGVALRDVGGPALPLGVQIRHGVQGRHVGAQRVMGAREQLRAPGRNPARAFSSATSVSRRLNAAYRVGR